jgi:trigger factor
MNLQSEALSQISVEVEQKPNCLVSLQVQVPLKYLKEEYEKAIRELNKEVSLPGYRKGKAPRDYMIDHFKKHIDKRWQDNLAKFTFNEALKQTSLYPMDANSQIHCEWKNCSLDEPKALAHFEYEILPQVPDISYADLTLVQPTAPNVDESLVEKELQDLATRHSSWKNLDQENLSIGNWVEIEATDDEQKSIYAGKRFEYTEYTMPKDLFEALNSMKKGEVKSCSLKRPSSSETIKVRLEVKNILEKASSQVDDQLAKQLGLESLQDLRKHIEKNLKESQMGDYRQQCFEVIQKSLSSSYLFEVPKSALGHETRMQENTLLSELGRPENELSEDEKKELKHAAETKAEAAIRQTFLLHKIASQENLKVEDHQVHQIMQPFMYELEKEKDQSRLRQRFQNLYSRCRMHLIAEKALEAIAHAKGWL